ncbi:MAG: methyltransferase domain-containing protein [Proteobacteria bacterium]|nr:methyltransferase domain-containing protein [Pseudomonadota bacterium]
MIKVIKRILKSLFWSQILKIHIGRYQKTLKPGGGFKVIFGGHWADHAGWLTLNEADQDITRKLAFPDESVDIIFTEHVIEHVSFIDGISFMRESKRILKHGGVFRVVIPALEKLLNVSLEDDMGKIYIQNLVRFYKKEDDIFGELGFNGLSEFYRTFFFNSIFCGYGHRFIWSAGLMVKVLKSLGYGEVRIYEVGQGSNEEYCIERRRRGLYLGNDWKEDRSEKYIYDVESLVIEAKK